MSDYKYSIEAKKVNKIFYKKSNIVYQSHVYTMFVLTTLKRRQLNRGNGFVRVNYFSKKHSQVRGDHEIDS